MMTIIALIIAYLLGSLSSAIILSKIMKFQDPRSQGSGNPGATNVLRYAGRNQALMVLIGDALKGLIAVLIGHILGVHGVMLGLVALAAVLGHVFPLYFKFKGGKGVATGFGTLIMLSFWVAVVTAIIWAAVVFITRFVSLASLVAAAAAVIFAVIFGYSIYAFPIFLIAALLVWTHKDNIQRLLNKTESKVNLKL